MLPGVLCAITDRARASQPLPLVVRELVAAGVRWVRVREPDLDLFAYVALTRALVDTAGDPRVTWSVRPAAWVLLQSAYPEGRFGVHLTERDAPWGAPQADLLLGRSVHVGASDASDASDASQASGAPDARGGPRAGLPAAGAGVRHAQQAGRCAHRRRGDRCARAIERPAGGGARRGARRQRAALP